MKTEEFMRAIRRHAPLVSLAVAMSLLFGKTLVRAADVQLGGTSTEGTVSGSGDMYFTVAGTERMRIQTDGDTGIGATSPTGLQVGAAVTETAQGVVNVRFGVASGTPRIILENPATQWQVDNSAGVMRFLQPGSVKLAIGSSGALYTNDWAAVSFGTGWSNYGGAFQACQYKKVGDLVFLRGLANSGANAWATYPTICTLPVGFRPVNRLIFNPYGNNTGVRVDVQNTGAVSHAGGGAGSGWISLSGIYFSVQ